jgi:hypothetical protein
MPASIGADMGSPQPVADVVRKARGGRQQVVDRDPLLVGGHLGKEPGDRIGRPQPPQRLELEDRGCGELLGDGADVEHRSGGHFDVATAICAPESLSDDDTAVLDDASHSVPSFCV